MTGAGNEKPSFILELFGKENCANKNYQAFVENLIDHEYDGPLNGATAAAILCGKKFVSEIISQHVTGRLRDCEAPRYFVWVIIDNEFSMLKQNTANMLAKIEITIPGEYGRHVSKLAYMSNSYAIL